MNSADSSNPFESPKQLTVPTAPYLDTPIRYEATATVKDLNSALRAAFPIIKSCLLLSVLLFAVVITSISLATQGRISLSQLMLFICIAFFSTVIFVRIVALVNAGKTYMRWNPNATALQSGELTNQGMLLKCQDQVSWHPLESIRYCKHKKNQLVFSYDPQLAVLQVLPKRGFQNPQQAIDLFEFHAKHTSPPDMAEPFEGPIMIGDQPNDAVVFEGILKTKDVNNSPLAKLRKRSIRRAVTWILITNAFLIPLLIFSFGWEARIFIGMFILLFNGFTFARIFRSTPSDPEHTLLAIKGWMNEHEIGLLSNVGQGKLRWQDFYAVHANDACIWLQTYGAKDRFVLLQRRFFADDVQWQAALEMARPHTQA